MGLDRIDREAMLEGRALSDAKRSQGCPVKHGRTSKRIITSDLTSDKNWRYLVRKTIEREKCER